MEGEKKRTGVNLGTARKHRTTRLVSRPVGTLLGEPGVLGLLVEGTSQHVEKLGDEGRVSGFGAIDGELSDVVSENVLRVFGVHRGPSLGIGRAVFPHSRNVALEPNGESLLMGG